MQNDGSRRLVSYSSYWAVDPCGSCFCCFLDRRSGYNLEAGVVTMKCKRCGVCCYALDNGEAFKCPHLEILSNGKTACMVYSSRIGRVIHKNGRLEWRCRPRKESLLVIDGCPNG